MNSLPPELLLKIASHLSTPADFAHFGQVDQRTHAALEGSLEQAALHGIFIKPTMDGLYAAKSFSQVLPWVKRAVAMLTRTDKPRTDLDNRLLGALLKKLTNNNSWQVPESERLAALAVAASLGPLAASMTRRDARHYTEWNAGIHEAWRQTALALTGSAVPGEHAGRLAALEACVPPGSATRVTETKRYLQSLAPGQTVAQRFSAGIFRNQTSRNTTV